MSRRMLCSFGLLLLFLALQSPAWAGNPLISPRPADEAQERTAPVSPGLFSPMTRVLAEWQLVLRARMADVAREIRGAPYGRAFWMFMLLSFAYGMIHAMGPGHGKLVTASYFLSSPASKHLALLFGQMTMFFHVLSAGVLVLAGKYLLEITTSEPVDSMTGDIGSVSYILLMAIGGVLLVRQVAGLIRGGHGHQHHHIPGPDHDHEGEGQGRGNKGLLLFAMVAGMVPCPGSALVLIFAISLGIQTAGLMALFAISLGMGLTISLIALATLLTRGFLLARMERHRRGYELLHSGISLAGSICLVLLGALLYFGRMAAAG